MEELKQAVSIRLLDRERQLLYKEIKLDGMVRETS